MIKEYKYIMFNKNQIGKDGYQYIQDVKYKIIQETIDEYLLPGKKAFINKFKKKELEDISIIGNIIQY
jgi:hypothetical protein